jgi:hypothetical protein
MPSKPGEEPAGNEFIASRTFCFELILNYERARKNFFFVKNQFFKWP